MWNNTTCGPLDGIGGYPENLQRSGVVVRAALCTWRLPSGCLSGSEFASINEGGFITVHSKVCGYRRDSHYILFPNTVLHSYFCYLQICKVSNNKNKLL